MRDGAYAPDEDGPQDGVAADQDWQGKSFLFLFNLYVHALNLCSGYLVWRSMHVIIVGGMNGPRERYLSRHNLIAGKRSDKRYPKH